MCVSIGGAPTDLEFFTQEKKPRILRKTDDRTKQPQANTYSHRIITAIARFFGEREQRGSTP